MCEGKRVMMCFSFVCLKSTSLTSKTAAAAPQKAVGYGAPEAALLYDTNRISGVEGIENGCKYTYKELKDATKGFHLSNKIGEGGFGCVYRGTLKDGTVVAVKVLSAESSQGEEEFVSEISAMSNIRHENLVKLRGCCAQGVHRILVYDYMEKNSLARILHHKSQDLNMFNWNVRSKIAFGVARGLAYLHQEIKPRIVHRDIKPSNILLDSDLTPKICDFGLAKLFPENITHISTRVAGTIGYLAPEYAIRGQVTRKSDVYSFGVLLMEIISGRSVRVSAPDIEYNLLTEAWELYKADALVGLVDPKLDDDFPKDEAIRFLKASLLCVQEIPALRPAMPEVVKMMSNETLVGDLEISQPGLIDDFMKMKIGHKQASKSITSKTSTSTTLGFSSSSR